jgi:hypothetical protein
MIVDLRRFVSDHVILKFVQRSFSGNVGGGSICEVLCDLWSSLHCTTYCNLHFISE